MVDYASQIRLPDYSRLASGVQGLIGLQGNLLQQRALTQQMEANKAASEAAKLSTDPVTGQIDQAKFTQLLSQGAGAYNIPEYLGKFQQLSNAQLEAKAKQLDIAQKQLSFFGGQLGSLVNMGERATPQDVIRTLANGVQLGMMTPEQAQQYATQIPSDPKELQSWLRQHWIGLQRTQEQIGLLPQGGAVDTGGAQLLTNRDPITGQISTAAVVPKTLSPGEAATRVPVFVDGQQGTVPLGATVGGTGAPAGGQGQPGSAPSGFLPTAPVLGQDKVAAAAADRYNSLVESANNAPTAINGYDRALEALAGAGTSGVAANAKLFLPTILQSLGLQDEGGDVQNFQSLKKYLANAGAQAASAAGYSGSDARLSTFTQGQPDPQNMNPGALRDAIQYVKALQTGVIAKNNAAQAWVEQHGGNMAKLPEFERRWSNAFNPDVMELRNLPPEQQRSYIASLKPEKRKALMESYRKMSEVGAF
ncbi:hypothetical protein [Pigmentiphaga daeguensis]|uniref:Uncharacterized protein n=1 Tax=Pigmentiphaga daeguensis TaxID=414049 RepID=A0ABP3N0G2_9BURK